MVTEVGVAVTSAGVPGGTAPSSVLPGNAAPGAGAQEPYASGVGGPLGGELSAARPQLIRALNGRLLLGHIRDMGPCSRAELARISGLSKPTVSVALADAERAGLVRPAGQRTGRPGRSALLYEVRPEAGFILGLDVGAQYVRGALADLAGGIRARSSVRSRASSVRGRVGELVGLADGSVDCIATDHAPHSFDEKNQEFDRAPFGITGLETALGLCIAILGVTSHGRRSTCSLAFVGSLNP